MLQLLPEFNEDEARFEDKVTRGRKLLADLRIQNMSKVRSVELLDGLLERIDSLASSARALAEDGLFSSGGSSPSRPAEAKDSEGSLKSRSSTGGREGCCSMPPSGQSIEVIDAMGRSSADLVEACRGRQVPLLLRRASAIEEQLMAKVIEAAGEDAVTWEVQGDFDKPRSMEGSLEGCFEAACQGLPGNALLMQDGEILSAPSLKKFAAAPSFFVDADLIEQLPQELQPVHREWLVIGSSGARSMLYRDPPWLGWNRLLKGSVEWRLLPPTA